MALVFRNMLSEGWRLVQGLISHAEVIELEAVSGEEGSSGGDHSPAAKWAGREYPESLSSRVSKSTDPEHTSRQVVLYERGNPTDAFTLILQGKVLIRTGAQIYVSHRNAICISVLECVVKPPSKTAP